MHLRIVHRRNRTKFSTPSDTNIGPGLDQPHLVRSLPVHRDNSIWSSLSHMVRSGDIGRTVCLFGKDSGHVLFVPGQRCNNVHFVKSGIEKRLFTGLHDGQTDSASFPFRVNKDRSHTSRIVQRIEQFIRCSIRPKLRIRQSDMLGARSPIDRISNPQGTLSYRTRLI